MKKYGTGLYEAHGKYLDLSYEYARTLKPKPTRRKKK